MFRWSILYEFNLLSLSHFLSLFFVFQLSPWDPESRELRAECYIRLGDPRKAIIDLTPATRLRADNRAAFLKLSQLHYSLGDHHDSLKYVLQYER